MCRAGELTAGKTVGFLGSKHSSRGEGNGSNVGAEVVEASGLHRPLLSDAQAFVNRDMVGLAAGKTRFREIRLTIQRLTNGPHPPLPS